MKTKKKYGLFKILLVILLLVVIATYFVDGRNGSVSYLAFGDVLLNYMQSFYYFFDTALFILAVGGLYGALNKVDAYKKLVKDIADKMSDNKKLFVVGSTIVFALLASLTGLDMILLIFVPFVISIILLLGYDKLVALSATIVATLVGYIGGIFITFKDSSSQYSVTYTTFDKMVGLNGHFGNVFPKILLLVVAVGLLIFYILKHIKGIESGDVKVELSQSDVFLVEPRDKKGKKVKVDYSNKKTWPICILGGLLLVILVLGFMPWSNLFGLKNFTQFHKWVTELAIPKFKLFGHTFSKYPIFNSLISSNFTALGEWGSLGTYMMAIIMIAVFLFILKFVSKVKFSDLMDGFIYGVKKMVPAVMVVMLSYTVLICLSSNGMFETIIPEVMKQAGDNAVVASILAGFGSLLYVDCYYTVASVFATIVSSLSSKADLSVFAVMFQSVYGLIRIVGPTSVFLIIGLSYLEVPYKSWLKYIWRFVLELLIAIFVVLMIVAMI